jgi:hypothetical protein
LERKRLIIVQRTNYGLMKNIHVFVNNRASIVLKKSVQLFCQDLLSFCVLEVNIQGTNQILQPTDEAIAVITRNLGLKIEILTKVSYFRPNMSKLDY